MKASQRIPKAIAVVIIIGIGVVHNSGNKQIITNQLQEFDAKIENDMVKSDSLDTEKTENRLFIYTKSIIQTTIRHLISTI